MPLTINVGLSRKSSHNFQSQGTSINLSAELDHALLSKPDQLQRQIEALYQQADHALVQQSAPRRTGEHPSAHASGNGRNGQRGRADADKPIRLITTSQLRALHAIADRLQIDLAEEVHRQHGCEPKQLDIRQASDLIDQLKARQSAPQQPSNGGRR